MTYWSEIFENKAKIFLMEVIHSGVIADSDKILVNGFNHDESSSISEESFEKYISRIVEMVELSPEDYLYEFGSGNGLLVYKIAKSVGINRYGGSDISESMIALAKIQNPNGDFSVSQAKDFKCAEENLVIFCNSVFQYFPSLEYTLEVLKNILNQKPKTFAFLDVTKAAHNASLSSRSGEHKSEHLTHIGFTKDFFNDFFKDSGYDVKTFDQEIEGYLQGEARFNVVGFRKR